MSAAATASAVRPAFCPGRRSCRRLFAFLCHFTLRPILAIDIWASATIDKILPNSLVVPAVVAAAWDRPMLPHRAPARAPFNMRTISVFVLSDQIGLPELPSDNPLVN